MTVRSCAAAIAALAVAGWAAQSAAETPKSALKMLKAAGMDAGVLKGAESDFAGLGAIVAGAKKEGTLKFRLTYSPKHFRTMFKAFKERYPFVEIEYTRGVGAGRAVKPLAAFKTGRYIADICVTAMFPPKQTSTSLPGTRRRAW